MKAIPWFVIGAALAALVIVALIGATRTVDNSTGVNQDALNEALQESLRDSYAPYSLELTPTPIVEDTSP